MCYSLPEDEAATIMTNVDKIYEKLRKADPAIAQEVLDFLEFLESRKASAEAAIKDGTLGWEASFGALKGSKAFAGDPVEIQRKLRDEWE